MPASTATGFTPARVVALVLVALLAAALGYVRFATGSDPVSVPDGAKAGDLILEPCEYATEDGAYDADCGTLVVPETRGDPGSRLIALPVTRIHARSADPGEPLFRLEGGPGLTNMEFPQASRFAEDRDVVLVGYRGVDGSVRLDCPEVESAVAHSSDVLSDDSFRAYADAFGACAGRLAGDGVDLGSYGLVQQVDDMEAARVALGYDRVDLLSESAGTRTALIYAWRHPASVHRSVLIGANPPGNFLWNPQVTEEQIGKYARLCAGDESCGRRTDDLAGTIRRVNADLPGRWWFLPIDESNVRVASFFGLMEASSEAEPINGPLTVDSWLSAADGDPSGLWLASLAGKLVFPKMFVWGQYAAAGRVDAQAARGYFASGPGVETSLGRAATAFAWGGGRMVDGWPATRGEDLYDRMRTSRVETLVVSGDLDGTTPPQVATRELMPHLPNGRQVVLDGFGHTVDFWNRQPEAGSRLLNAFLADGRLDDSRYVPERVDFTPSVTQGTIAKIVLGAMLGLAALAVLSLLLMARRVRRQGGFGRRASAVLRSVYPVVLGLGGWVVGVLVVLTALPGVPLDDELLAVLSAGIPVGLGVYLAWVHRDRPGQARGVGLAAAVAGALAGAWLGFHATSDVLAVLTAVAGSIAGANLTLVLLDAARARPATAAAPGARGLDAEPAAPAPTP